MLCWILVEGSSSKPCVGIQCISIHVEYWCQAIFAPSYWKSCTVPCLVRRVDKTVQERVVGLPHVSRVFVAPGRSFVLYLWTLPLTWILLSQQTLFIYPATAGTVVCSVFKVPNDNRKLLHCWHPRCAMMYFNRRLGVETIDIIDIPPRAGDVEATSWGLPHCLSQCFHGVPELQAIHSWILDGIIPYYQRNRWFL